MIGDLDNGLERYIIRVEEELQEFLNREQQPNSYFVIISSEGTIDKDLCKCIEDIYGKERG